MLDRKTMTRLRKIRSYLERYAHGAGADVARKAIDEWIEEDRVEHVKLALEEARDEKGPVMFHGEAPPHPAHIPLPTPRR